MSPDEFIEKALAEHNRVRVNHSVEELTHNPELSKLAQTLADELASKNILKHGHLEFNGGTLGQNLIKTTEDIDGANATLHWYNEISKYDYEKPGFSSGTGNFTQVIWKETTQAGFGIAKSSNDIYYVVANYSPGGNVENEFEKNVLPLKEEEEEFTVEASNDVECCGKTYYYSCGPTCSGCSCCRSSRCPYSQPSTCSIS